MKGILLAAAACLVASIGFADENGPIEFYPGESLLGAPHYVFSGKAYDRDWIGRGYFQLIMDARNSDWKDREVHQFLYDYGSRMQPGIWITLLGYLLVAAGVEGGFEAASANDSGLGIEALTVGVTGVGLAYLGLIFAGPPTEFVAYYNGKYSNRSGGWVSGLSP